MGSRQGTRAIVVDGVHYAWRGSWAHDLGGTRLIRLAAWLEGERGSPLEVWLEGGMFIAPKEVAAAIRFALAHGWAPAEGRAPHRLAPSCGLALPGWRVSRQAPLQRWAGQGPVFAAMLEAGAGAPLAAALGIEAVPDADGEWEHENFLVRSRESWTAAYTRSFVDLLSLLEAAQGRAHHADRADRKAPRQYVELAPEEALRLAGPDPFPGARALGERIWLRDTGAEPSIESITLQTHPPRAGSAWRWLTLTRTGVVDRRAR